MIGLSRLNGWQRLWLVATALALVFFGALYPAYEVYGYQLGNFETRRSIEKGVLSPACRDYLTRPASQLEAIELNGEKQVCYDLYLVRKNPPGPDVYPYSIAIYDAQQEAAGRKVFFLIAGISSALTLVAAASVYLAGWLVAWIRRGFLAK